MPHNETRPYTELEAALTDPSARLFGTYRGLVVPGSVRAASNAHQIVCDVYLFDHMPTLLGVPVMSGKINRHNGSYVDLEDNDLIAVQFLSGNPSDPVIIGCLPPSDNAIQTEQHADMPRYHVRHQGTDVQIDKEGNVTVSAAKDITITVSGNTIINSSADVAIQTTGSVTVQAAEGVSIDGIGTGITAGLVTAMTVCPFTNAPHSGASTTVTASM